jgi:hypothetical protein
MYLRALWRNRGVGLRWRLSLAGGGGFLSERDSVSE